MSEERKRKGGCQCGQVRITVTGDPMVGVNCHCLVCQGLSGAGHMFVLVYPAQSVEIEGKVSQFKYKADSGKMATRYFCPTCGSQLYGTSEQCRGHMESTRPASRIRPPIGRRSPLMRSGCRPGTIWRKGCPLSQPCRPCSDAKRERLT